MKISRKVSTLLIAGLFLFASACKKDVKEPLSSTDCLLTKITWKSDSGGSDDIISFTYDENRRPISANETYEGTVSTVTIEYSTDGKIAQIVFSEDNEIVSRNIYTWTTSSLTVKEELKNDIGEWESGSWKDVALLDELGKVIEVQYYIFGESDFVKYSYDKYTWNSENISNSENWDVSFGTVKKIGKLKQLFLNKPQNIEKSTDDAKYSNTVYEYDDKPNAFSTMNFLYDVAYITKNNILKQTINFEDGSQSQILNYTYEYNEYGLPTKQTISMNTFGTSYTSETLFEYECK